MSLYHAVPITLAYVAPEAILPFSSFVAALFGVVLMFWQRVKLAARRLLEAIGLLSAVDSTQSGQPGDLEADDGVA